jgi:hypothetical protein
MAGKKISGAYPDSLNFPDSIIPKTSKISDMQKALFSTGALNIVDHVDPFGRTCKAYAGFTNPHDDTIRQINQKINQQWTALPDNWDHSDFNTRAEVQGNLIAPGQPTRKLTDDEIRQIKLTSDVLKDVTYLSNRQSGMCIDELGVGQSPWSALGNTAYYGSDLAIPTSPSSPGGVVVPGLPGYMSLLSTINQLATTLSQVPNVSTGPCAFIEDAIGSIMKAGSVLNEILAKILQLVGVLAVAMAIVGLVKMLIDIIKGDLQYLGQFIELLKQAALAGLLEGILSDPCLAYLLTAGIATFTTLKTLGL